MGIEPTIHTLPRGRRGRFGAYVPPSRPTSRSACPISSRNPSASPAPTGASAAAGSASSGSTTAPSTSGWPAAEKQTLLLTTDDCSGLCVGGRFVERDTTWNHFLHFRGCFERHGLPQSVYTDALSLFGPSSSHDHSDPKSEFQRALRALHVAHLVAPSPQAKGKIERRFGTFQNRLVTLFAHEKIENWNQADELLQMELDRQNRKVLRSTGKVPAEVWEQQLLDRTAKLRPTPGSSLLDLHFSLRSTRKVHLGHIIQFDGRDYEIAPTSKHSVTVLFHPFAKFWVLEHSPNLTWPPILGHFTL